MNDFKQDIEKVEKSIAYIKNEAPRVKGVSFDNLTAKLLEYKHRLEWASRANEEYKNMLNQLNESRKLSEDKEGTNFKYETKIYKGRIKYYSRMLNYYGKLAVLVESNAVTYWYRAFKPTEKKLLMRDQDEGK